MTKVCSYTHIKQVIVLLLTSFLWFPAFSQEGKINVKGKNYSSAFTMSEGRITGTYISFYSNGKKKATGNFINGMRTGEWKVWDSLGNLKVKRLYKNGFEFEQLLPVIPKKGPIPLLMKPDYFLTRNSDSFIPLRYLQQRAVVTETRTWRYLSPENNELLFKENKLLLFLLNAIKEKKFDAYNEDEFITKSTIDFQKIKNTDSLKILGFCIKEDWFFDFDRMLTERRIISISPMVKRDLVTRERNIHDTVSLFNVYYPQCRKFLAQQKAADKSFPAYVKNMDDIFFFRCFSGIPYRVTEISDRVTPPPISTKYTNVLYTTETKMMEDEHDLWIYYAGGK
ncbi:MAG: hypothetical protein IAF38_06485 [Bacteroidia bacterium]|nr:hypothetical protein [Bacteroidia bacterium]